MHCKVALHNTNGEQVCPLSEDPVTLPPQIVMNTINTPQIATPPPLLNPALGNNTAETGETSFKDMLFDSFQEVNNMQLDADKAVNEMFTGGDVSPAEVLTAVQKADLAFRLTMQMRNKLMEVYQEVRDIRI